MYRQFGQERELEITKTIEFIRTHPDIKSTLDVGAHSSGGTYAQDVKNMVKTANGVDVITDEVTPTILDNYFIGNVTDSKLKIPAADLVFSISSIEHSGISTYKSDWQNERVKVFATLCDLAKKYVLVTCPYGKPMIIEGQYANITPEDLVAFEKATKQKLQTEFYFRNNSNDEFRLMSKDLADEVEFDETIGVPKCIAVIKVIKNV